MPAFYEILSIVAAQRGVSEDDIRGYSRKRHICRPRQEVVYLARTKGRMTLPQIGRSLNRDHTTVIHAIDAVQERMADDEYRAEIGTMGAMLQASFHRHNPIIFRSVRKTNDSHIL